MEKEITKKPIYEYNIVAPIFENKMKYNSDQIMDILNIKRTAYSQWWKRYEKDKAYTDEKIEKELVSLKMELKEKENKLQIIEIALNETYKVNLEKLLENYE